MSKPVSAAPPDQAARDQALDPARSILVQAPAGSGKTTLLTERFLALLGEVDDPGQVVAITFTNAAAAEMRNRILDALRAPEPGERARRVLERSELLGWKLLGLPAQLRISTIDSFCRELALQQPLLSGLGGGLAIAEQPGELYRRAARQTLQQIGQPNSELAQAVEKLLEWRDNNWLEVEALLVDMLSKRDRWMQDFVLSPQADWEALRAQLEQPFARAVRDGLAEVAGLLDHVPGAREEALALARFACGQLNGARHRALAELVEFPEAPFVSAEELAEGQKALGCLAELVLTDGGTMRQRVDKNLGFPPDRKEEKARIRTLIAQLEAVPGLEPALAKLRELPPARYTEEDWVILRASFTLLRHAAAYLRVTFSEAATVDFIEVAQIADSVLRPEDGYATDAAQAVADGIRHLLVDEFQDTSRRQHRLLASLIGAWPDAAGRTCFAVGDPMQSIYFFRDADAELFGRVKQMGLEIPGSEPMPLEFVPLTANFRTTPKLVSRLNGVFEQVFAADDGSGVQFSAAEPVRPAGATPEPNFELHLAFCPQISPSYAISRPNPSVTDDPKAAQVAEVVDLIRSRQPVMDEARQAGRKYRMAVLARTRAALSPIAEALREAAVPFRAVDLEKLATRPEVLDALALGRALLNPQDRLAWLGVLRAPWCGLSLADLHTLTSADDPELLARPIPELLGERLTLLSGEGRIAVERLLATLSAVPALRLTTGAVGTSLQQVWLSLGGAACVDATGLANLNLLWSCLDGLAEGEQDLLGPALATALEKLTAQPDPAASGDCGVQLMTIHKSKGLEFEVVIVPEMQAKTSPGGRKLLSWLERGLKPKSLDGELEMDDEEFDASGEVTEFLIAPMQPKGADRGSAKAWVDRVYCERETQETRRILYVAATRAREELHLFARPAYKVEANGELALVNPSASLLATAWPALENEIRARFEDWKLTQKPAAQPAEIASLAASAGGGLFIAPARVEALPPRVRRLPADYQAAGTALQATRSSSDALSLTGQSEGSSLYRRHEGGVASRALGTAVHGLLEELARLRLTLDWPAARAALALREARVGAQVRAAGIAPREAAGIASRALEMALAASHHPHGAWIVSPRAEAESEVRWTGVVAGSVRTVQVDRVFRGGLVPGEDGGEQAWWIVDYKTHAELKDGAAGLDELRALFAPQLEAYAQVLRSLHGADALVRAGLYYPRVPALDWWEI